MSAMLWGVNMYYMCEGGRGVVCQYTCVCVGGKGGEGPVCLWDHSSHTWGRMHFVVFCQVTQEMVYFE